MNNETAQGGGPSLQMPGPVNKLLDYPRRMRQFLHEVRVEMKQVTWPTQNDVYATTVVVIVTTIFFAVFLWLVDVGVSQAVGRVLKLNP
jgi:preprotein translocase subunit SecE